MRMLARRLSWVDLAFLAVGATIGSGIFRLPSLIAARVPSPSLMLSVWVFAGVISLIGAGVFAELAARRPVAGGQYAYLRDALHPLVGFEFVWTAFLVGKPAAIAAASILFAGYALQFAGSHASPVPIAAVLLALLTAINCLGVRTCANVQNAVMILKIAGILAIIAAGLFMPVHAVASTSARAAFNTANWTSLGAAYVLATFAYGGWSDVTAMTAETKNAGWAVGRGILVAVAIVTALYVLTNAACIRALGISGLVATTTPATDVLRAAFGVTAQRTVALFVMFSTLGYIYTKIFANPRFAHAMARDGLFFAALGAVNPKTSAPIAAIVLHGCLTIAFATCLSYEQLVAANVGAQSLFVALCALALLVFRTRDGGSSRTADKAYRLPGHPYTTVLFFASMLSATIASIVSYPVASGIVVAAGLAALPFYRFWSKKRGSAFGLAQPAAVSTSVAP